ncbi:piggyBac transposable element-derived protein 2-like [Macrosteles quadrilineatus]|uniref:piggyBac transposable element-derived protein 2-like n=1 Tax=Macrosteles quadrilineatus TaxID=74068 RepID=UPI0023E32A1A|nr:piggyBac transposable element-derived protein 2-like [Macrosteles quadrilineatus]
MNLLAGIVKMPAHQMYWAAGTSGDIVLRLVEIMTKHLNYKVFEENLFNYHKLRCALKNEGLLALKTVRENRSGRCPFSKDKDLLKKGHGFSKMKIDVDNKVRACKWVDNKVVCLLSTFSGADPADEVERWSEAEKRKIQVPRPAIVMEYNASMRGVDLHDMLVELCRNNIKVSKPYLRIFYHMVDKGVVTSWLLYRRHLKHIFPDTKRKTLVVIKDELAESLIKSSKSKRDMKRGRPSAESAENPRPKKHTVAARPAEEVRCDSVEHSSNSPSKRSRVLRRAGVVTFLFEALPYYAPLPYRLTNKMLGIAQVELGNS